MFFTSKAVTSIILLDRIEKIVESLGYFFIKDMRDMSLMESIPTFKIFFQWDPTKLCV